MALNISDCRDELNALRDLIRTVSATPSPLAMELKLHPKYIETPALRLISDALHEAINKPDGRLILSVPPQEGKTELVRAAIVKALRDQPDLRVILGSYNQSIASHGGAAIKNLIEANPDLGLRIAGDTRAKAEWKIAGHNGGLVARGRGSGVAGRAADCVRGDMHIVCEYGRLTAADAFSRGITRILAYDHTAGRTVWRNVEAARRIDSRPTLEITTEAGRVLVCTPDHRVHTGRGYVPAGDLRRGDTLVAVMDADRVPMRDYLSATASGPTESDHPQAFSLLHAPLQETISLLMESLADVERIMRRDVLQDLRADPASSVTPEDALPRVWDRVSAQVAPNAVLRENVRRSGALAPDDREGKLALQDGHELRQMVPVDATHDPGAGRQGLRGLPAGSDDELRPQRRDREAVGAGGSPHQRTAVGQPCGEPDHALPRLPHDAPQVTSDTVRLVRASSDGPVAVYDFQVEGTSNFFAGGVLVHNCLIIDDPFKEGEAQSETIREEAWTWYREGLATRLSPGASVILIMTRWHADDLVGRLIEQDAHAGWTVLNISAQCDNPDTDPLGRAYGEFLLSARGRTREQWEQRKLTAGSQTWNALYQGRPSPAEGGLVKRDWWQRYATPLWEEHPDGTCWATGFDELIMSADLTFKGSASSDRVAIGVWGRRGAHAYLLDLTVGRMEFVPTVAAFTAMAAKWPQATLKLVEDKANGPALMSMLAKRIPGIVPYDPGRIGKVQRLLAVAPLIEAGNVHIPIDSLASWADEYIEEHAGFPNAAHDDLVDMTSQALDRLLVRPLSQLGTTVIDVDDYDDWRIGY